MTRLSAAQAPELLELPGRAMTVAGKEKDSYHRTKSRPLHPSVRDTYGD